MNGAEYVTNRTGWVTFNMSFDDAGKTVRVVTGVNCSGITKYEKLVSDSVIIWDRVFQWTDHLNNTTCRDTARWFLLQDHPMGRI